MEKITTIGLAKSIFQVHAIAEDGGVVTRRGLGRSQVLEFFRKLEPCLVGLEACASAHYWANSIIELGHTVRMMPAAYVKAYVKRNKTDAADAEAICEAVTRVALANKIALTIWALRQGRYLRNDLIRRQSAETSSVPMLS